LIVCAGRSISLKRIFIRRNLNLSQSSVERRSKTVATMSLDAKTKPGSKGRWTLWRGTTLSLKLKESVTSELFRMS
jgi:hypothetical protein